MTVFLNLLKRFNMALVLFVGFAGFSQLQVSTILYIWGSRDTSLNELHHHEEFPSFASSFFTFKCALEHSLHTCTLGKEFACHLDR